MGSREAPYDKHKECDNCGEMGAHDFMGDYFCDNCVISYPDPDSVIQKVGLDAYTELGESHDAHVKEVERLQKELDELNNLKLVDQHGELLLECRIGDKNHQLLLDLLDKYLSSPSLPQYDPFLVFLETYIFHYFHLNTQRRCAKYHLPNAMQL